MKKWSPKVTHLIFFSSSNELYESAKKQNCHIILPKWVLDSDSAHKPVNEDDYVATPTVESNQERLEKKISKKMTPTKHDLSTTKKRKRQDEDSNDKKEKKKRKNEDVKNKKDKEDSSEMKTPQKSQKKSPRKKVVEDWGSEGDSDTEDEMSDVEEELNDSFVSPRRDPPKETAFTVEFTGTSEDWDEDEVDKKIKELQLHKKVKGGFKIGESPFYGYKFTHLIMGNENKRSLKVLFAIAYGAKIVNMKWWEDFLQHAENEKDNKVISVLDTKGYEIERWQEPSNAFANDKISKNLFHYKCISFHGFDENTTELFEKLVTLLGGRTTTAHRRADVCVVNSNGKLNETCLSAQNLVDSKWLSDSIENSDQHLSTKEYEIASSKIENRKSPDTKNLKKKSNIKDKVKKDKNDKNSMNESSDSQDKTENENSQKTRESQQSSKSSLSKKSK